MSLIDPSGIPGADIDLGAVRSGASGLSRNGGVVRDQGAEIVRDWQRMPSVFEATGTESLYTAMTPVGTTTTAIGDSLDGIARALTAYASDVEPIKARLDSLRSQAVAFAAKANSFHSHVEWISSGYTLGIPAPEKVDSWDQDPGMNDENNSLIRQVAQAEADWLDAQQRCATAIRAAVGLAAKGASDERALAAQLRSGDPIKTPWGATADRKESCSEKALTFQTHFLWDGVIVGFGWNTLKSIGALVGVDPTGKSESEIWRGFWSGDWSLWAKGQQDSLAAAGHAWLGVAHLASGLVLPPAETEAFLSSPLAGWMPDGVRDGLRDWNREDGTVLYGTLAGMVGLTLPAKWWDPNAYKNFNVAQNWVDNPGGTAGTSAATIASFFIPGAGEARGAGIAGDAARVADGARLGDLITDGSIGSLRGLSADALKATIKGLSDADAAKLATELAKPELDMGALSSLKLDDLTIHEPVPHEPAPAPDTPGPPAETVSPDGRPTSSAGQGAGSGSHDVPVDARDAGARADRSASALDRTAPHDDPAGVADVPRTADRAHPGPDGPAVGSEPVHDGPHDASTAERPAPREDESGLYNRLQPDDKGVHIHYDLVDSKVPVGEGGPGWERLPDLPAPTDGVPHGDVLPEHGAYTERTTPMDPKSASLRTDPEAPWGRMPDGRPLTQDDWVARYQKPDGFAYPDNGGAVAGTRAEVTDLRVILQEFGPQVDRIGYPGGGYLSPIVDSAPFSFESRGLVPDTLYKPYTSYIITADRLPEGWTVVVSRVAPAEGFPGGALQMQFFDHGQELSVIDLERAHVLE